MLHRLREFWLEARARSAGRRAMGNDKSTFTAARGIVGATGNSFSNAWALLESDDGAYMRSLDRDRAIPPSLFVSERDRVRLNQAVPLPERCIEDHRNPNAMAVGDWEIDELEI
ncbi:MAG: hypothetical protein R8J94_10215 [Acidimicrobiia bacterium]|nr:hypothetical protein [Acidimicrobiia bacterium]